MTLYVREVTPAADFSNRVAGVATLAEPVRRALYQYVVAQRGAVSRDEAAAGVHVPRHTAKFHLDRLVREGLLTTEFRRLSGRRGPGAGRPSKLYRRSDVEVSVSLPERSYDLAGQLMARAIETAARTGASVVDALHDAASAFGSRLGEAARAHTPTARTDDDVRSTACQLLADQGYEPRVEGGEILLQNCPFHALAAEHTELVCGMNLALVSAATERLGHPLAARLCPGEGRCCVVVDAS